MNLVETDWRSLTPPEQIRHLEVEGFAVLPAILDGTTIAKIKAELAEAEMGHALQVSSEIIDAAEEVEQLFALFVSSGR